MFKLFKRRSGGIFVSVRQPQTYNRSILKELTLPLEGRFMHHHVVGALAPELIHELRLVAFGVCRGVEWHKNCRILLHAESVKTCPGLGTTFVQSMHDGNSLALTPHGRFMCQTPAEWPWPWPGLMPWGPEAAGEQPFVPADVPEGVQTPSQTVNVSYIPCIIQHAHLPFARCSQVFYSFLAICS